MSSTSFPARLHVILARDSSQAIVIRRGPSKLVAVIGWERKNDTFMLGQWLKGQIYPYHSDLSPDGKYFIYFAKSSRLLDTWTAVSKAPYLKAMDFYKKKDNWSWGGGLFSSNKTYLLNDREYKWRKCFRRSGLIMSIMSTNNPSQDYLTGYTQYYLTRLNRDGWQQCAIEDIQTKYGRPKVAFSKMINNVALYKLIYNEIPTKEQGKQGGVYERHQLLMGDKKIEYPTWEWADIDGERIVWAEQGKLMAAKVEKGELSTIKELADFNSMQFEERIAPYK